MNDLNAPNFEFVLLRLIWEVSMPSYMFSTSLEHPFCTLLREYFSKGGISDGSAKGLGMWE